jgi:DNA ligase 1
VKFADLAAWYDRLEALTKRLEMRAILVEMLRATQPSDLPIVLYLSQGMLRPEYEGVELGVADSLARKAVVQVTGASAAEVTASVRATGDLGTTAAALLAGQKRLDESNPLGVDEVYAALTSIAQASGEGSQDVKVRTLVDLLNRAQPAEGKYILRFVLGTLRLGVREMSLLDALAVAFADGSKEARTRIEAAYNLSSDLGQVAVALASGSLEALTSITLEVGRPIRPMLAERALNLGEILERMPDGAAVEYKYDGLRVQAHIPAHGEVKLFSRRLENISAQFPELVAELPRAIRHKPAIVEGECVPIDPTTEEILPFQEVSRRRGRKRDLDKIQSEIPVCVFLFDVLMAGGAAVMGEPFPARRKELEKIVGPTERIRLASQTVVHDVAAAQQCFDAAIADGCEGIVAKSIAAGSAYRAGARGFWWIKYKRDYTQTLGDSIDGVVVGAFYGRGRRAGGYGALLLATYNPEEDRYESFCKVGGGFDDATVASLPAKLKAQERDEPPKGVVTELTPDRWIEPHFVLEVRGAELTLSPNHRAGVGKIRPDAGLALRFPRSTGRWRDDKGPTEATTSQELVEMYRKQVKQSPKRASDA